MIVKAVSSFVGRGGFFYLIDLTSHSLKLSFTTCTREEINFSCKLSISTSEKQFLSNKSNGSTFNAPAIFPTFAVTGSFYQLQLKQCNLAQFLLSLQGRLAKDLLSFCVFSCFETNTFADCSIYLT